MSKITLRIVGLFFNETFEVDTNIVNTVKDVVIAYRTLRGNSSSPGGLDYTPITGGSVQSFTYNYPGYYNFNGFPGKGNNDGPTLGGSQRQAGVYTLSEPEPSNSILDSLNLFLTWQYYVVSKSGKVKSKTGPKRDFTPWDATPNYSIVDGDTIIWRLVAIYNAPRVIA